MSARSWAPVQGARPRPHARIAFASGKRYEREGDLEGAARWFRRAAEADLSDAALRLGDVLGRLAVQRDAAGDDGGMADGRDAAHGTGRSASWTERPSGASSGSLSGSSSELTSGFTSGSRTRDRDRLMAEATRWLSEAHTARHPDAIEMITDMLNRQQRLAALRAGRPAERSGAPR